MQTNPNSDYFTYVCDPSRLFELGLNITTLTFCDTSLHYDTRAKVLVDSMTLTEKVKQLGDVSAGVERLGIPPYNWWSEGLHGVSNVGSGDYKNRTSGPGTFFDSLIPGATSFPTPIVMASSFNESLWKTVGQAVSTEARAMHNLGRAGLTFWSPNINVVRDPRWGRIQETPGEDPFVVGRYAINYVRGLQDVEGTNNLTDLNSRPLKVSACCKHFTAYDVDHWHGVDRKNNSASVSERDMLETFLPPFEMCVKDGDVSSVMCSYNRVNGIPTCADPRFLRETIREEWNLHGYIVADCSSVKQMHEGHHFLNGTKEDAVALALRAGLNLECAESWLDNEQAYMVEFGESAVRKGKVRMEDIDSSLRYLYVVLMRLGFFDGNPYFNSLGKNHICSAQHIELATEAARQGIVLLKNDNGSLPLDATKFRTLAVVGPHANATDAMIGNYAGIPCQYTSPIDGFLAFGKVVYNKGCDNVKCNNESYIDWAVEAAQKADATIIVVGLDLSIEAEDLDRDNLLLPANQIRLINQVSDSANGPVILVIMSAGGVDISFAKDNRKINAILWAGYPGEEGGRAIAEVVFGKYNPGGRLPITWHQANYTDELPMTSMSLRPVEELGYPGRTYKFFNGSTIYPFGYGLSYTKFSYTVLSPNSVLASSSRLISIPLDKFQYCRDLIYKEETPSPQCPAILINDLKCDDYNFKFEVEVKNVGTMDGSEVVIVYSQPPSEIQDTYLKQVIGFKRIFVETGKTQTVKFEFNICKSLGIVDYEAYNLFPSGLHTIFVGDGDSLQVQASFQRDGLVLDDLHHSD